MANPIILTALNVPFIYWRRAATIAIAALLVMAWRLMESFIAATIVLSNPA
jgi:hypothetical protein